MLNNLIYTNYHHLNNFIHFYKFYNFQQNQQSLDYYFFNHKIYFQALNCHGLNMKSFQNFISNIQLY